MDRSRLLRILRTWVQVVFTVAVASLLWPSALGGNVDYVMVSGHSMEPGLQDGDLVIVRDTGDYEVGDAVAYRIPEGEVGEGAIVIHRITEGDGEGGFVTQGDNRDSADLWNPRTGDVVGERWVHIAGAGDLIAQLRNPAALGALAGMMVFAAVAIPPRRNREVAAT